LLHPDVILKNKVMLNDSPIDSLYREIAGNFGYDIMPPNFLFIENLKPTEPAEFKFRNEIALFNCGKSR